MTAAFKKLVELELVWEKRCGRGDANQIYLAYVTPQDDPAYASAPFTAPEENTVQEPPILRLLMGHRGWCVRARTAGVASQEPRKCALAEPRDLRLRTAE